MLINQGCQTNARKAKLFISSEGELMASGEGVLESPDEYKPFVEKVNQFSVISGFSRFRVYGEIREDGEKCIVLVTEFRGFKDNIKLWGLLNTIQRETKAHLWIMDDSHELEYSWQGDADGALILKFGENHGRPVYQVELSWRIESLSAEQVKGLIHELMTVTEPAWQNAGVGVC